MEKKIKEPKKIDKHGKGGKINESVKPKANPDPGPKKPN